MIAAEAMLMRRTKGYLSTEGTLRMIYELGCIAAMGWRLVRGFEKLAAIVAGANFMDSVCGEDDVASYPKLNQETETLVA